LINQSACAWSVVLTPSGAREPPAVLVPVGATVTVNLTPGDYSISQTALAGFTGPDRSRLLTVNFAAGESYQWPLATLLHGAPEPPP